MPRSILPAFALVFAACNGDDGLTVLTNPPTVTIQHPADGTELNEGVTVEMVAAAQDDKYETALDSLTVRWAVDGAQVCDGAVIAANGESACEHIFSAGTSQITVTVTNPDGEAATATSEVVVNVNGPPDVEILTPVATDTYYSDNLIEFEGIALDTEDPSENLAAVWNSSLDGDLDIDPSPTSDGKVAGALLLSEGEHYITLVATDTTGRTGQDQVTVTVGGPNNLPECSIDAPEDYAAYSEGDTIIFEALVDDADIPTTDLTAEWASDQDGDLGASTVTSNGELTFSVNDLTVGTHTITLSVTDEIGGNCTDAVVVQVGNAPYVELTAPSSGATVNDGDDVAFQALVSDANESATALTLSWESDIDGTFSTQGAASDGYADFTYGALSVGTHTITVTATDSDGFTGSDSGTLNVNDLPGDPTILLTPTEPTSGEDLEVLILADATDAEGDAISYTYSWTADGITTSHTGTTVSSSDTTRGETWIVTVTAQDAWGTGGSATDSVEIDNSLPVITSASLTPDPADSTDTLTCTPGTTSDADGDTITYSYSWDVSGATLSETGDELSGEFSVGDTVTCTVTPNDGYGDGAAVASNTVTIENSAPEIGSVSLSPTTAYEADTLTCTPEDATDADGDGISYTYAWRVDGADPGVTTDELDGTYFDRDDDVYCTVTPSDGADSGDAVDSNPVTISNTPPTVASASISPSSPVTNDSLTCSAGTTADEDPADSVSVSYRWEVDGASAGTASATLGSSSFVKGQAVVCYVTPNDGTDDGAEVASSSVTVGNTAPSVSSVSISPSSPDTNDDLTAVPSGWSDDDGDDESYDYQWYINGSAVVGGTGETLAASATSKANNIYVVITPDDGTDTGTSATSSTVTVVNSPPSAPAIEITPGAPSPDDSLACTVTTSSVDPDGDSVNYTYAWTKNGTTYSHSNSNLPASHTSHGETWGCSVYASDSSDSSATVTDSVYVSDTTAPTDPVIDAIDEYRNEDFVTLSGSCEDDCDLTFYFSDSGGSWTDTSTCSSGSFSHTEYLSRGTTTSVYAICTDDAGNSSGSSNTVSTEACDPQDEYEDTSFYTAGYGDDYSFPVQEWASLSDDGSTVISITGNILDSGDEDWYLVQTTDDSAADDSANIDYYYFHVQMSEGTGTYLIDIYPGSPGSYSAECTGGDEFEYYNYDQGDGSHSIPSDPRFCSSSSGYYNECTDYDTDWYIEVYRSAATVTSCQEYELSITNGLW